MFRSQPYLEETKYVQFNLDTPLTFPGNNQTQNKSNHKFTVGDRDNFYDWYNAFIRADFKFEAKADGADIAADTQSPPINSSFSLIRSLKITSSGKTLYEANNIHKGIFQTIIREALQKTNFGILTLTPPQKLMAMRQTPEFGQGRFYHMEV